MTSLSSTDSPSQSTSRFSISLVVATRSRLQEIAERLPLWTRAGFDEVVIVDGSFDAKIRQEMRNLCDHLGAVYVAIPKTLRDRRSYQRNLGARVARGSWILFQDDDDDVPLQINHRALERATLGMDWLTGPKGEHLVWHRRDSFLAFGGYPEDMVAAEDGIMSNRARASGRGGLEPEWFAEVRGFPRLTTDPLSRARNAFWYGYTVMLHLCRTPHRRDALLGDFRRQWYQLRQSVRDPWRLFCFSLGVFGRALSPLHCLGVRVTSGRSALRQEAYHGWQGLRP